MNRKTLCNDLDEQTTSWFLENRVPEAPRLLLDPVPIATFPVGVPLHYVRLLQDRGVTDDVRDRMIARLPDVDVHDLDSGHLPMLSQPAAACTARSTPTARRRSMSSRNCRRMSCGVGSVMAGPVALSVAR